MAKQGRPKADGPKRGTAAWRAVYWYDRLLDDMTAFCLPFDADEARDLLRRVAKKARTSTTNAAAALDRWRPEWRE